MSVNADAQAMDRSDPLRDIRDRFDLPPGIIYLNGNSLGAMPRATVARMDRVLKEEWAQGLIRSWNSAGWVSLPQRLGAKIARLIGAREDEVIVADSTSVNLFKLIHGALKLNPGRSKVVTERGNFPTDLYILQGVERDSSINLEMVERDELDSSIDEHTALLVLTQVHYKTGEMFDLHRVTERARNKGVLVLWDLSHSTGAVPVDLGAAGADFAVGCGYKYLNGGPGAPSFLYVAKRHQAAFEQPLTGWFGHERPFAMSDQYVPAAGLERALCGTPAVLGCAALEEGVDLMLQIDAQQLRAKSVALTERFIEQVERSLSGTELELVSPRSSGERGSQVSFRHPEGYAIIQALIEQGVIGDFRAPDILRFGFSPLYIGFADVDRAAERLVYVIHQGLWNDPGFQQLASVT